MGMEVREGFTPTSIWYFYYIQAMGQFSIGELVYSDFYT